MNIRFRSVRVSYGMAILEVPSDQPELVERALTAFDRALEMARQETVDVLREAVVGVATEARAVGR